MIEIRISADISEFFLPNVPDIKLIIEPYANVTVYDLRRNNGDQISLICEIGEHAQVTGHTAIVNQSRSATITLHLNQPHAQASWNIVTTAHSNNTYALTTKQWHNAPLTTSNIVVKGILTQQARCTFDGLIVLENAAKQAVAEQDARMLLLSSTARAQTIPALEIKNNDVTCRHANAVGSVSQEQLLYLTARGLDQEQAQQMLVEGFLLDMILQYPQMVQEELQNAILCALRLSLD